MKIAMGIVLALVALAGDLEVGKPAGDVALGKDSLAALAKEGKVVAVYFWSQDCPYGPPQYDHIKEVDKKFAGNDKVKVVLASAFGEPQDKAEAWAKDFGLKSTFIFDGDKKIAKHFGARKVNSTYVVDGKGVLVYRGGIANDKENLLLKAIDAALEGKPAPASDGKFEGCGIKIN